MEISGSSIRTVTICPLERGGRNREVSVRGRFHCSNNSRNDSNNCENSPHLLCTPTGIQHTASQAAYQRSSQTSASHHSVLDSRKDSLSSCNAIAITKYLLAVVESCEGLFPNCG